MLCIRGITTPPPLLFIGGIRPANSLLRAGMLSFPRIPLSYFQDIPIYFLCVPSAWSNLFFGPCSRGFFSGVFCTPLIYIYIYIYIQWASFISIYFQFPEIMSCQVCFCTPLIYIQLSNSSYWKQIEPRASLISIYSIKISVYFQISKI